MNPYLTRRGKKKKKKKFLISIFNNYNCDIIKEDEKRIPRHTPAECIYVLYNNQH